MESCLLNGEPESQGSIAQTGVKRGAQAGKGREKRKVGALRAPSRGTAPAPDGAPGQRHLRVLGVVLASGVVVVDSWKGDKVQEGAESWT